MPEAIETGNVSVDEKLAKMNVESSVLPVDLNAVVDNFLGATVNVTDSSPLKDSVVEEDPTISSSLYHLVDTPSSHVSPVPGPGPSPTWATPIQNVTIPPIDIVGGDVVLGGVGGDTTAPERAAVVDNFLEATVTLTESSPLKDSVGEEDFTMSSSLEHLLNTPSSQVSPVPGPLPSPTWATPIQNAIVSIPPIGIVGGDVVLGGVGGDATAPEQASACLAIETDDMVEEDPTMSASLEHLLNPPSSQVSPVPGPFPSPTWATPIQNVIVSIPPIGIMGGDVVLGGVGGDTTAPEQASACLAIGTDVSKALVEVQEGSLASSSETRMETPGAVNLDAQIQSWLDQAKGGFQAAVSAAISAAEKDQLARSALKTRVKPGKEVRKDSAAAVLKAAASVTKDCADAAKVGYEAAVQASILIADDSKADSGNMKRRSRLRGKVGGLQGDGHHLKKQKTGDSPDFQGQTSGHKADSASVFSIEDRVQEHQRDPRVRTFLVPILCLPATTIQSRLWEKTSPKRTSGTTEVSTQVQASTPLTTRSGSHSKDDEDLVKFVKQEPQSTDQLVTRSGPQSEMVPETTAPTLTTDIMETTDPTLKADIMETTDLTLKTDIMDTLPPESQMIPKAPETAQMNRINGAPAEPLKLEKKLSPSKRLRHEAQQVWKERILEIATSKGLEIWFCNLKDCQGKHINSHDSPCAAIRAAIGWPAGVPLVHPHHLPKWAHQAILEAYKPESCLPAARGELSVPQHITLAYNDRSPSFGSPDLNL